MDEVFIGMLRKLHGDLPQLCVEGEVGAVERTGVQLWAPSALSAHGATGKFGLWMKGIHIWVTDSTNPKIHLSFGLLVGVLYFDVLHPI
jgi:hypothetical protein